MRPLSTGRTSFEKSRRVLTAIGLVLFLGFAISNDPPDLPLFDGLLHVASLTLLIIAFTGRLWASVYLVGRKSKVLCTEGPFSISRNPLYFFSFLGAVGIGLLTDSVLLATGLAVAYLLFYHFIIRDEERRLSGIFGPAFDDYRARVPRLFPVRPWLYRGQGTISVQVRPFIQGMIDSSGLLWAYCLVLLVETLIGHQLFDTPPNWWQLP